MCIVHFCGFVGEGIPPGYPIPKPQDTLPPDTLPHQIPCLPQILHPQIPYLQNTEPTPRRDLGPEVPYTPWKGHGPGTRKGPGATDTLPRCGSRISQKGLKLLQDKEVFQYNVYYMFF